MRLMVLFPQFLASPVEDLADLELEMAELINAEREARGSHRSSAIASSPPSRARMATAGNATHELDRPVEERIKDVLPNSCLFGENVSKHTNIDYSIGDMMASAQTCWTRDSRRSA